MDTLSKSFISRIYCDMQGRVLASKMSLALKKNLTWKHVHAFKHKSLNSLWLVLSYCLFMGHVHKDSGPNLMDSYVVFESIVMGKNNITQTEEAY